MAKIELNIVALGDFSSVNTAIKDLQAKVIALQKNLAGVGIDSKLTKDLNAMNAAFKQTMLSTGQFTASTVKMTSETEKFGQQLESGKLKLVDYYNIIKRRSSEATTQMKALAIEQTKLQNSIVVNDPTKQGILSVYTPTQINKVANATKIAANEANLYAIAVNKGSQSLINWGKNTQWAGRQLTVGLSVPLMLFGQQATTVFKDVNNELVRLAKVYGTGLVQPSKAALDAIRKDVLLLSKELASSMGIAVKDTASMAADLAATGLQGNDLLQATRESIRLSKLGELDTQKAMQATISLRNVYKLSTQQLSGAVNFLNAVENQTSTSLQDLVDGIPRVGPIVKQLGGDFKDTAIMMVAMKEAGVPAAQSANAIKSAIASLINPTRAAKDAFMQYGIGIDSIATATGGNPVKMIMMLQQSLKGLEPLVQAQLIEKLFGKFQEARIQALITNLGSLNSQTKTAFDLAKATDTQLSQIAAGEMKTATESVTGKFQRAVESMKANLIPIGEKILDFATKLLNFGNSVAKVFGALPGPLKSFAGALALGVALAGPIIMLTGLLGNFVGFLIRGAYNLKQLAMGGKTLGQILTPEMIAAQNATQLFDSGLMSNVESVNLLNQAVKNLTMSMEGMLASMNVSSGISSMLAATAEGMPGFIGPLRRPKKFAQGGFVKGNPADGDVHPALLTGKEAVIPYPQSVKYSSFISRMINGNLPGYHKGKVNHEHPHNVEGQYGEGEDGGIVYIGPKTGKTASAPAPIQGLGSFISTVSGDRFAIDGAANLADERMKNLGIIPPTEGQRKSYNQFDLAHVEHTARMGTGQKVWDLKNLVASTSAENNILNMFDKEQQTPETIKKAHDLLELARQKLLTGGMDEDTVKKEIENLKTGGQPVGEAGRKVYKAFLEEITSEIETDIKKMKSNPNAKPSSMFIGSHKDGVTDLTPYGRMAFYANEYTGQRGSGGSLTPLEMLRASNYSAPQKGRAIPLAQWEKDFAGAATERPFDATSPKAGNAAYVLALKQRLEILKHHGLEEEAEYKIITANLVEAERQQQLEIVQQELKGMAARMNELRKAKQTETAEYKLLGQQLAEGYALGIISGAQITKAAGSKLVTQAVEAIAITQKSKSPSLVARMLGRWFGVGYATGITDEVPAATAAGAELAGGASMGTKFGGLAGKKIGGLAGKVFKGGLGKGSGIGIGAMMVGSMITPQLGKVPGIGQELSGAASFASMASMTMNPYIIGAAAVAGFAYSGIKHLIEIEKRHEAEAKATFTSSTNAMQFFGQSIENTGHRMSTFSQVIQSYTPEQKAMAQGIKFTNDELEQFKKLITSLPKNDPLSLIVQKLKETSDSGAAAKIAQDFANTQMAINGLSKENADKLIQLSLSLSGHSSIAASTSASMPSQLAAIKKLLVDSAGDAKTLSTNLGSITNLAINTSSWVEFKAILDGISQSGLAASQTIQGLYSYLMNVGDAKGAEMLANLGQQGYDPTSSYSVMQRLLNAGYNVDISGKGKTSGKTIAFKNAADFAKQIADQKSNLNAILNKIVAATGTGGNNGTSVTPKLLPTLSAEELKKLNDKIAKEEKSLKTEKDKLSLLNKQLKTQRDLTAEMQRQKEFNLSKTDLENQIRLANASGDFMKAALLQQELAGKTVDFANQGNLNDLQSKADKQSELVAEMQLALDADKAALQKNTDALNANTNAKSAAISSTTASGNTGKSSTVTPGKFTSGTDGGGSIPNIKNLTEKSARQMGYKGKDWLIEKTDNKGNKYKTLSDSARAFISQQYPDAKALGGFTYQGRQYNINESGKFIDVGLAGPNAPAPHAYGIENPAPTVPTFSPTTAKTLLQAKTLSYEEAQKNKQETSQGLQFTFGGQTYSTDTLGTIYGGSYNDQFQSKTISMQDAQKTTLAIAQAQSKLNAAIAKLKADQNKLNKDKETANKAKTAVTSATTQLNQIRAKTITKFYTAAKRNADLSAAQKTLTAAQKTLNSSNVAVSSDTKLVTSDTTSVKTLTNTLNSLKAKAKLKAAGGAIFGPGSATSDSIFAMLSNGEYVVRASSVAKYGKGFFDKLNGGEFDASLINFSNFKVPSFNTSAVGSSSQSVSTGGTIGGSVFNITVNAGFNATADDIAKSVMDTIKRNTGMTNTDRRIVV